jgi:hypothetical protein
MVNGYNRALTNPDHFITRALAATCFLVQQRRLAELIADYRPFKTSASLAPVCQTIKPDPKYL